MSQHSIHHNANTAPVSPTHITGKPHCAAGINCMHVADKSNIAIPTLSKTATKYSQAVELFATTDMTARDIADRLGISVDALRRHLQRHHRQLIMARRGLDITEREARMRGVSGQTPAAAAKYGDAIKACASLDYIEFNVSQIARSYNLDASALANQLRTHFPDIIPWREEIRRQSGLADNAQRGVRRSCTEAYAAAVEMCRTPSIAIGEAAKACGVSPGGLGQHVRLYHADIAGSRRAARQQAKTIHTTGTMDGNGRLRRPRAATETKYARAVDMAKTSSMPVAEIARQLGLNVNSLRTYLLTWHRDILVHRSLQQNKAESN